MQEAPPAEDVVVLPAPAVREATNVLVDQDALVLAARELEPLPTTVTRLARILARHDWEMREVEEAIALDQALTPRILRLANSALSSRGHRIATVGEAVMRVGTGPLFSMAMALGVKRRFAAPVKPYGLAEGELWKHSVAAALTVESLGARLRRRLPVESFTAALLHDVGKLVLARFLDEERLGLLRAAAERGRLSERDAELEILGVDHGELGAIIAQHWQLPDPLVRAVQHHHAPDGAPDRAPDGALDAAPGETPDRTIAHVVHVADFVADRVAARRRKAGGEAPPPAPLAASTRDRFKLDDAALDDLAQSVDARLADVLERYA
jgi:putative nucleotidyltransferase with HDIG domain